MVVSDPTPERPGLASARLPGLQNCRGAAWKRRGAAMLQPTTAGSNLPSSTRRMRRERSQSILSCGGNDTACGRFIHRYISKWTIHIKKRISLQIWRRGSYRLVRWVSTSDAQLRWQAEIVVSDPTPERPSLASARLPGLQNCRGAAWKRRGAATLQPTTAGSNSPSATRRMRRDWSQSILSCGGNDTACGRFIHRYISKWTIHIKKNE
jgi:hypothetical protein